MMTEHLIDHDGVQLSADEEGEGAPIVLLQGPHDMNCLFYLRKATQDLITLSAPAGLATMALVTVKAVPPSTVPPLAVKSVV